MIVKIDDKAIKDLSKINRPDIEFIDAQEYATLKVVTKPKIY